MHSTLIFFISEMNDYSIDYIRKKIRNQISYIHLMIISTNCKSLTEINRF